ncbi:hypothetical protein HK102_009462, partial [Quaeritorhiza haematococci]
MFASLAISGVSFVSKAAFSFATSMAVKQINSFVQETAGKSRLSTELARLERRLQQKLAI